MAIYFSKQKCNFLLQGYVTSQAAEVETVGSLQSQTFFFSTRQDPVCQLCIKRIIYCKYLSTKALSEYLKQAQLFDYIAAG